MIWATIYRSMRYGLIVLLASVSLHISTASCADASKFGCTKPVVATGNIFDAPFYTYVQVVNMSAGPSRHPIASYDLGYVNWAIASFEPLPNCTERPPNFHPVIAIEGDFGGGRVVLGGGVASIDSARDGTTKYYSVPAELQRELGSRIGKLAYSREPEKLESE